MGNVNTTYTSQNYFYTGVLPVPNKSVELFLHKMTNVRLSHEQLSTLEEYLNRLDEEKIEAYYDHTKNYESALFFCLAERYFIEHDSPSENDQFIAIFRLIFKHMYKEKKLSFIEVGNPKIEKNLSKLPWEVTEILNYLSEKLLSNSETCLKLFELNILNRYLNINPKTSMNAIVKTKIKLCTAIVKKFQLPNFFEKAELQGLLYLKILGNQSSESKIESYIKYMVKKAGDLQAVVESVRAIFGAISRTEYNEVLNKMLPNFSEAHFTHFPTLLFVIAMQFEEIHRICPVLQDAEEAIIDKYCELLDRFDDHNFFTKKSFKYFLKKISGKGRLILFTKLFHSRNAGKINKHFLEVNYLEIKSFGQTIPETFFPDLFLKDCCSLPILTHYHDELQNDLKKIGEPSGISRDKLSELTKNYAHKKWIGRTLIFYNERDGEHLAIKWQKIDESTESLQREKAVLTFLRKHKGSLSLRSELPEPIDIYFLEESIDPSFYTSPFPDCKTQSEKECVGAGLYVYKCKDFEYFKYIDNPSLSAEKYDQARSVCLHDLMTLAYHGIIMTAIIPLFHTLIKLRSDQGRHIPFITLFTEHRLPSGKLVKPIEGCKKGNLRLSGIADFAEFYHFTELLESGNPIGKIFQELAGNRQRPGFQQALYANFLAEIFQADQLILAKRMIEKNGASWSDSHKVAEYANEIQKGYITLFFSDPEISRTDAENFVATGSGINWEMYAKQKLFWMKNNDDGYVPYVEKGVIPPDIYGKDCEVKIAKPEEFENWTKGIGFSGDRKHSDLGPINGIYPVTEAVRARYLIIIYFLMLRQARIRSAIVE